LAFAEAHAYVTLESYVVRTREFECVETGQQRLGVRVVVPLAEYRRVGRAPILVGYNVLVLYVVFNRFRHTAPGVSSIDAYNKRIYHYRSTGEGNVSVTTGATKVQTLVRRFKYF